MERSIQSMGCTTIFPQNQDGRRLRHRRSFSVASERTFKHAFEPTFVPTLRRRDSVGSVGSVSSANLVCEQILSVCDVSHVPIILSSHLGSPGWTRRAAAAERFDACSAGSGDGYATALPAAPQLPRRPAAPGGSASRRFHCTSSCPEIKGMPFGIGQWQASPAAAVAAAAGEVEETSATEEAADEVEGGKEGQESLESRLRRWHESMGAATSSHSLPHASRHASRPASRPASPSPPPPEGLFVPGLPHWTKRSLPRSLRISRSLLSFQERALLEHRQETALLLGMAGRKDGENELWSEIRGESNKGSIEESNEKRQARRSVRVKSESSLLSAAAAAVAAPVSPGESIRAAVAVYSASREFWRPPSTPKPVKQAKVCLPRYSPPVPPIGLEKLMEGGTGAGGTGGFAGFAGFGGLGGWGFGAGWWGAVEGAGEAGKEGKEGASEAGWLGLVDAAREMMWEGGGDGGGEGVKEEENEGILGAPTGKEDMGDQEEGGEAVEGEEKGLTVEEEKLFGKACEGDSGGIAGEGGAIGGG
ncbi:unnamed protein product [Closterium sp. Yama58-4]|nr:unnamed protein product [Closterium sp. Yama58-4]